jgi:SWI/SNF chromatin-remodeling complex subunit SWI1
MLCQYYMAILFPFEELYKRNIPEHQRRMQMAPRPSPAPFQGQGAGSGAPMQGRPMQGMSGMSQSAVMGQMQRQGGNPMHAQANPGAPHPQAIHTPVTPTQRPSSASFNTQPSLPGSSNVNSVISMDTIPISQPDMAHELNGNVLDQDVQGIKRKMEFDDGTNKRARQKTGEVGPRLALGIC